MLKLSHSSWLLCLFDTASSSVTLSVPLKKRSRVQHTGGEQVLCSFCASTLPQAACGPLGGPPLNDPASFRAGQKSFHIFPWVFTLSESRPSASSLRSASPEPHLAAPSPLPPPQESRLLHSGLRFPSDPSAGSSSGISLLVPRGEREPGASRQKRLQEPSRLWLGTDSLGGQQGRDPSTTRPMRLKMQGPSLALAQALPKPV